LPALFRRWIVTILVEKCVDQVNLGMGSAAEEETSEEKLVEQLENFVTLKKFLESKRSG